MFYNLEYKRILEVYSEFEYELTEFKTEYNNDLSLDSIIEKYRLNKLVDKKNFLKTMITFCKFVYRIVPSNGTIVKEPYKFNGLQLIELCSKGYSLNCAGYSILLSYLLINFGYKVKCIYCQPYNVYDDDSHVLCHVYNESKDKWIIVDPAQGCIPCDSRGDGINILELRAFLEKNKKITLLRSFNTYYNQEKTNQYIKNMYKNIFMFLVLDAYGNNYSIKNAYLIIPKNCDFNKYDISFKCCITKNTYYLFN